MEPSSGKPTPALGSVESRILFFPKGFGDCLRHACSARQLGVSQRWRQAIQHGPSTPFALFRILWLQRPFVATGTVTTLHPKEQLSWIAMARWGFTMVQHLRWISVLLMQTGNASALLKCAMASLITYMYHIRPPSADTLMREFACCQGDFVIFPKISSLAGYCKLHELLCDFTTVPKRNCI